MITRRTLLGASLLALAAPASADAVDDYLRGELNAGRIPGLALAVVRDGKVTRAVGYGMADLERRAPVRPETPFVLDSMTKQFTALTVMQRVQRGEIRLDESVRRYIPGAPPDWQPITVRNLLTHTAGFPHDIQPVQLSSATDYHPDEWLQHAFRTRLLFPPGSKYQYSNAGYSVLAIVVERVSHPPAPGAPYVNGIFRPLDMERSGVYHAKNPPPGLAVGYTFRPDGMPEPHRGMEMPMAAGGLYSTVLDLAKYDAALYGDRLVTQASLQEMWSPFRLTSGQEHPYGFGWAIHRLPGTKVVFHNGGGWGYNTAIYRYLEPRITVILLTNHYGVKSSNADRIVRHVSGLIDPRLAWPEAQRAPTLLQEAGPEGG